MALAAGDGRSPDPDPNSPARSRERAAGCATSSPSGAHRAKAAHAAGEAPAPPLELALHPSLRGKLDDPGAPYYGGLQMSYSFQQTYGGWLLRSKGTANHWSPLEQIWTAVRAHRARGFAPWPNTARGFCGLA